MRYDNLHGDEDEIRRSWQEKKQAYEDYHADDWKYLDERLNEQNEDNE